MLDYNFTYPCIFSWLLHNDIFLSSIYLYCFVLHLYIIPIIQSSFFFSLLFDMWLHFTIQTVFLLNLLLAHCPIHRHFNWHWHFHIHRHFCHHWNFPILGHFLHHWHWHFHVHRHFHHQWHFPKLGHFLYHWHFQIHWHFSVNLHFSVHWHFLIHWHFLLLWHLISLFLQKTWF